MKLKIKAVSDKIGKDIPYPFYATAGAAAMDLCACVDAPVEVAPRALVSIPTGIAIALPSAEYVALVFARSGLGIKHGIALSNGVGVIDSDYRGEIRVGLTNLSDTPYTVQPGDRIAQLAVMPVVQAELERQIPLLPRSEIARASIDNNGKIIVAENLDLAIDIANEIAPEHLELCVDAPFDYLDRVRCAGSIFLGKNCPEALGDYLAGTNHVLPTGGTAKFSSALSVDDFVVKSQFTYYTADALAKVGEKVACFARREGLDAHANSVTVRLEEKKQ